MSGKAIRETLGVRGLWGLEQLERMGLSLAKLALVVMTGSVTVSLLVMVLVTGIPDDRLDVLAILFTGVLIGLVVFAALALARWTQADIESLLPVAPEIEPSIALLPPTRSLVIGCLVGLELPRFGGHLIS